MRRLIASDDRKYYNNLTNLLESTADSVSAHAKVLKKKTNLVKEFSDDLGEFYKQDTGNDIEKNIEHIIDKLEKISTELNDIAFDVKETVRIGQELSTFE